MKDLKFVTIFPDDNYFTWQCHLWLESLRNIGHSDKAVVLIFTPKFRTPNREKFQPIIDLYPEAEFAFYQDNENISPLISIYIPIIRPYTAWRYWLDHPEMKDKAVFYCDSDILFTEKFDIQKFLDDDINYSSDTNSYINASYFDSKVRDVLPDKLEEYKTIDVLNEAADLVGINREICEKNNLHSGGTQYLLKNINAAFWKKVMKDTISIRKYLMGINKTYFESESKGFQSWCADMWGILWNVWDGGAEMKVVPELEFAWAPDPIEKLEKCTIYHNAGISGDLMEYKTDSEGKKYFYPCFYKGKYHRGEDPLKDSHLEEILNDEESKKHCTWYYALKLKELGNKYKLMY